MPTTSAIRRTLALCALLSATASQAQTWDASADYTLASTGNPNGVWTYGYSSAALGGAFVAFDRNAVLAYGGGEQIHAWLDADYSPADTPSFGKNVGAVDAFGLLPGQLYLHPGPAPGGDDAIVRFTAPVTARYRIDAAFLAGNVGDTAVDILHDGALILADGSTADGAAFSFELDMAAGGALDFAVGNGGSFDSDTTPFTLTISAVPEPATALLWMAGAAGLASRVRRRRGP